MDETEIQKQLLSAFQTEAQERIEALFTGISGLEEAAASRAGELPEAVLDAVFREAHSLKGAARSVNLATIESLCQEMENIFAAIKAKTLQLSREHVDSLYAALRLIEQATAPQGDPAALSRQIKELVLSLAGLESPGLSGTPAPEKEAASPSPHAAPEAAAEEDRPGEKSAPPPNGPKAAASTRLSHSVRISTEKLDALLLKTEELITYKQSSAAHLKQMNLIRETIREWRQEWKIFHNDFRQLQDSKSRTGVIDRTVQFIDHARETMQRLDHEMKQGMAALEQDNRHFTGLIDDLLDETKKTALLPFSTLFSAFPRMVREIAGDQGKSVDLKFSGDAIEVDKRILEGMKDPLMHLLRNAIDHGLETPSLRREHNKPEKGSIRITVSQLETNHVCMEIVDDGRGVDVAAVKADAVKKGLITAEAAEALSEAEALDLIFLSGISSTTMVTEISGRGLGMSIVREALENLGGRISMHSASGMGTTFVIKLPVTLATFRGVLIEAAGRRFILPTAQIRHSLQILPEAIQTIENRMMISFNAQPLAVVYLSDILGLPPSEPEPGRNGASTISLVVLEYGHRQIAFGVDAIINEQEVLVKSLGKQLKKVHHVSGATILGSGEVVPILNIKELVASAAGQTGASAMPRPTAARAAEAPKSILIVEDSFTSRTLLKNILEAYGYQIQTAIDGTDGLARLKSRHFDAVVSDVEMPRMDGLELTQNIRADQSLADLPVILVTSLDSPKDRERGVEVGADAYIVKGSFDQSNLLEMLDRLL